MNQINPWELQAISDARVAQFHSQAAELHSQQSDDLASSYRSDAEDAEDRARDIERRNEALMTENQRLREENEILRKAASGDFRSLEVEMQRLRDELVHFQSQSVKRGMRVDELEHYKATYETLVKSYVQALGLSQQQYQTDFNRAVLLAADLNDDFTLTKLRQEAYQAMQAQPRKEPVPVAKRPASGLLQRLFSNGQ